MQDGYRFLFGPVRSRRLGRSLGIDLVPLKVCTYDCPYCQVGATTLKTLERRDYVSVAEVLAEFDHWRAHDGQADCVTLAGGGEPTLHARFGEVIDAIGARTKLRRILLSNGSLFSLPEVRAAAIKAEVVKATLSAWDQASFEQAHHPHPELRFDAFVGGLKALRGEFKGEYWLEVFAVPGVNDTPAQMTRIADIARLIAPDRIHLNTATRPAQDGKTVSVPVDKLNELAGLFSPVAEVVGAASPHTQPWTESVAQEDFAGRILSLLQRHPCTVSDISATTGQSVSEVDKTLKDLLKRGSLRIENRDARSYFVANAPEPLNP
jgi:wyosine [tRNA(Phe)-imidazoG37] synthetase (radical SAM superfamily)